MKEIAEKIISASPEEISELASLLKEAKLGVFTLDGGGQPQCPQGEIWNGTKCVPNV